MHDVVFSFPKDGKWHEIHTKGTAVFNSKEERDRYMREKMREFDTHVLIVQRVNGD